MSISRDKFKTVGLPPEESTRGSSSISGTKILRHQLPALFQKYSISSMFDAGCSDGIWSQFLLEFVKYSGGDVNHDAVKDANQFRPDLNITEFDILADNFPLVDLVFVRDVGIHLTNAEKILLLTNFVKSQVPWLMITHLPYVSVNHDIPVDHSIVTAETNWCLLPWNFPAPVDTAHEFDPGGRCMGLWHRNQIKELVWL